MEQHVKSEQEHKYTSTGIKFWRHTRQLESYRAGTGHTVVSTHISPEGRCNLKCAYCSVAKRTIKLRIELTRIQDYVTKLQRRGLKAVIITGGGEPALYPQINELVRWLKLDRGLSVALITNGTVSFNLDDDVWSLLSWVRVSINTFKGYKRRITLPHEKLAADCVPGCSYIVSNMYDLNMLRDIQEVATKCGATYVRVLPNCLLPQDELDDMHALVQQSLSDLNDPRFFHQDKNFRSPDESTCHQSFFRPYLSEVPWREDGVPGSVYPCDSVVLNDAAAEFEQRYQLCKLENVLEHLDGRVSPKFLPRNDCPNCVFCHNVEMLGRFMRGTQDDRAMYPDRLTHEEFV